jgi:hypothetical protein
VFLSALTIHLVKGMPVFRDTLWFAKVNGFQIQGKINDLLSQENTTKISASNSKLNDSNQGLG